MVTLLVGKARNLVRRVLWVGLSMCLLVTAASIPIFAQNKAFAAGPCQVTDVNPHTVASGSDTGFAFSVLDVNDDLAWIRVTSPNGNLVIVNAWSDWLPNTTVSSSYAEFSGSPISAGNTLVVNVEGIVSYFPPASWTVEASTDPSGSNPMTCSGDTSLTVTDTTPPNISNVSVTPSQTSATVSWDTDKTTTGEVDYGTTTNYTGQALDTNAATSHSVTLNSLTAGTTYHYIITATDQNSNTSSTADSTFFTTPTSSGGGGGTSGGGGGTNGTGSTSGSSGSLNTKVTNP